MPIKINDFTLPKEKIEKEYPVVNVTRWQEDGEILGWSYECLLPKLRYEKISVKIKSENPVITPGELKQQCLAMVTFTNLMIAPLGRSNVQFVSYGLSAMADVATLIQKNKAPLHKLRHTGATLARQSGVSLEKISEALTHSDTNITKTYVNTPNVIKMPIGEIAYRKLPQELTDRTGVNKKRRFTN